jgi:hypothetical protein
MTGTTGRWLGQDAAQSHAASEELRREHTNLDNRYGRIGISAVAAALRYSEISKNPAYAPVIIQMDWRSVEAAA